MTVPISQIPALAQAGEESIRRFEVDPDGSFIHWRDLDVHLGWEQLEQIADPGAARKAQQQHRDFNVRYGAAIGRVRNTAGFGVDAIAGLSAKQLRRIERGECRLMPNAVKALANAHGVTDNAYLAMVAKEAARNPS